MSAATKVALGVASGYVLGRTKKLRLAITVGSMLAGHRVATNPQALLAQGAKLAERNPELKKIQDEVTGRLVDAARHAALTTATQRMEALTASLREQQEGAEEEPEDQYDDQGADEEPEDEADDEPQDEPQDEVDDEPDEEGEEADEKPAPRRRTSSKGREAKKPAQRGAAKRTAAKKSAAKPAEKSTSKGAAAKKSTSKRTTSKRTTSKRAPSSRGSGSGRSRSRASSKG